MRFIAIILLVVSCKPETPANSLHNSATVASVKCSFSQVETFDELRQTFGKSLSCIEEPSRGLSNVQLVPKDAENLIRSVSSWSGAKKNAALSLAEDGVARGSAWFAIRIDQLSDSEIERAVGLKIERDSLQLIGIQKGGAMILRDIDSPERKFSYPSDGFGGTVRCYFAGPNKGYMAVNCQYSNEPAKAALMGGIKKDEKIGWVPEWSDTPSGYLYSYKHAQEAANSDASTAAADEARTEGEAVLGGSANSSTCVWKSGDSISEFLRECSVSGFVVSRIEGVANGAQIALPRSAASAVAKDQATDQQKSEGAGGLMCTFNFQSGQIVGDSKVIGTIRKADSIGYRTSDIAAFCSKGCSSLKSNVPKAGGGFSEFCASPQKATAEPSQPAKAAGSATQPVTASQAANAATSSAGACKFDHATGKISNVSGQIVASVAKSGDGYAISQIAAHCPTKCTSIVSTIASSNGSFSNYCK